jgi:hypothetical protein
MDCYLLHVGSARKALKTLIKKLDGLVGSPPLSAQPSAHTKPSAESVSITDIPSPHLKVLMYFDETHCLANCRSHDYDPHGRPKTLFNILLSVLNDYLGDHIFVIFMSTVFEIPRFAPVSSVLISSARFVPSEGHQAPITEVPFDCSPDLGNVRADSLRRSQVSDLRFMAQFGRPL